MAPKPSPAKKTGKPRAAGPAGDARQAPVGAPAATTLRRGVALDPEAQLSPGLNLTIQLVLTARRWRALLDERLRPIGQSAARMEAMSTIAHAPPRSAQIEIARRIGVEGATLTRMLDSLEADGLVERMTDPADRRTKHLRLTDAGRAALAEIAAIAGHLRGRLLEAVDAPALDQANAFLSLLLRRIDDGLPPRPGE